MTYNATVQMGNSQSLLARVAACAAEQGNTDARNWASANLLKLASDSGYNWASAWDYAKGAATVNVNPDTGQRDDVISDAAILSAVQAEKTANPGVGGWPAS